MGLVVRPAVVIAATEIGMATRLRQGLAANDETRADIETLFLCLDQGIGRTADVADTEDVTFEG